MPEGVHRKPRLRRTALRVVMYLLLGAAVNVAVAWGFAVVPDSAAPGRFESSMTGLGSDAISVQHFDRTGATMVWVNRWTRAIEYGKSPEHFLPSWYNRDHVIKVASSMGTNVHHQPITQSVRVAFACGWPARSLICEIDRTFFDFSIVQSAWDMPWYTIDPTRELWLRVLPYAPLWPGFAINTLFYAAILWLITATARALRRWRRLRRGLCVKCAYPVGASDVCTECGVAVRADGVLHDSR